MILYLTTDTEDYLSDSILLGLKALFGDQVIEFPKNEIIYSNIDPVVKQEIRGGGFTYYTTNCQDSIKTRYKVKQGVFEGKYSLIIFSCIHRQFGLFLELYPSLKPERTIILDGEDTPAIYPYLGKFWRNPLFWFLPKAHKKFLYFKREWTSETLRYRYYKLFPSLLINYLPNLKNLRTVSFSIPEEKIIKVLPRKEKMFPKHIVDLEILNKVEGSYSSYAFKDEGEYYKDLQNSKFGITTKRAGWDCLRHYEIAANGAVICFKDLDKKPINCAPHGLDNKNSISYSNYEDLKQKINGINENDYLKLQQASLQWVMDNSCKEAAKRLIEIVKNENRIIL